MLKITLYTLILMVLFGINILYIQKEKEQRVNELSQDIKKEHQNQLNSTIYFFKNKTSLIFSNIINKEEILELHYSALHALNEDERGQYRKLLYTKLEPLYMDLRRFGIKQLHFHFPDTTSFLRFHKPEKFGDNLENTRYSLVLANREKREVTGFEEGRIFNGYRYVFPLFYKNEHIGSVETSLGFNAINTISKHLYKNYPYMILDKKMVLSKLFKSELTNYSQSDISPNFYHESNLFVDYKRELLASDTELTLEKFNHINELLHTSLTQEELAQFRCIVKYFNIDGDYYSVNFLPIHNIENESVGYIVYYEKSERYGEIIQNFYEKLLLTLFIFIMLIAYIFKTYRDKRKLQYYVDNAEIQRQKALSASKSKSEFLANMSHEIRTPLNAILGFVEILQKESMSQKAAEYIHIIHGSSQSLIKIIEDILDFSKIESGKLEISTIDFDLRSEMKIITHLFEAKCSTKNITLKLLYDQSLPQGIHSDPLRIKQILVNLISNAIKFTSSGKKIYLSLSHADNYLKVSVRDEGKGIAPDKLSHIFEAFAQEDSSTTREYGGTGLGLSISAQLVKLLGGELKVTSRLGEGSEFYFSIPAPSVEIPTTQQELAADELHFHAKALLVEDNKTNQQFMQIVLEDFDISCDVASNGIEAIELFKTNRYDVILMDENMPQMGGIEATRAILEIEKDRQINHTPIIALTANALKGDREKFLEAGMDEYISKPIDTHKLAQILHQLLKK